MTTVGRTPPTHEPPPGAAGRHRLQVHWELIACGFGGHVLVGTDAAVVREDDAAVVREAGDLRWYRCLRCDTWSALPPPATPARKHVPATGEIELPVRGKRLRDRYVLRLIAVEKSLHVLVVALLVVGIVAFAAHRRTLHGDYTRILNDFQASLGGPAAQHHGVLADLDKLFALSQTTLDLIAVGLAAYGALLLAEMVGLWGARRWAEYLAFVETAVFVPYELYELSSAVSVFKVLALVVNLAIALYLILVHHLFGLRGRLPDDDAVGWDALRRATPPAGTVPPPA